MNFCKKMVYARDGLILLAIIQENLKTVENQGILVFINSKNLIL